jgi:hypothetical protein
MHTCVMNGDFISFYDFYVRIRQCSDSVILFLVFDFNNTKRLLHDIFHIGPSINRKLPYQARQRSWSADM